jgi:hypothetical protein
VPFVLPVFNVPVNVWHLRSIAGPTPIPPADLVGVLANVSLGRRVAIGTDTQSSRAVLGTGVGIDLMIRIIMFPAHTDVRGPFQDLVGSQGDAVEVPAGSGAFYFAMDVADMGKGFPNEHRVMWACPSFLVGLPTPLP